MVEMSETARAAQGALGAQPAVAWTKGGAAPALSTGSPIAWAVAEYLHDQTRAKVLFATHFHELTDLRARASAGQEF